MLTPADLASRLAAHPRLSSDARLRAAGVLVALSQPPGATEPRVLFIKRADHMRHHHGQYAFPGGARDPEDGSITQTALREAHEEVGLAPGDVQVLGLLDDQATISGFLVTPVVGWIPPAYPFRPNADEVAAVVQLPLGAFLVPPRAHTLQGEGFRRIVLAYDVDGHFIWGATASILRGLAQVVVVP